MIHPGAFPPRVTHPSLELSSAKNLDLHRFVQQFLETFSEWAICRNC